MNSSSKWYYTDPKSTIMYCEFCYEDDQFSIITNINDILNKSQLIKCGICGWCPKKDGLTTPNSKSNK